MASTSAYQASVAQSMGMALNQGCTHLVFTTGGRSERFARAILEELDEVAFIQIGEFLGWSLKEATGHPAVAKVTVAGMVGKLAKIAQGRFELHRNHSQVDPVFLAGVAAGCGAGPDVVAELEQANTARHFQELCRRSGLTGVFRRLCELCCTAMQAYVAAPFAIETIMTDFDGTVLGVGGAAGAGVRPGRSGRRPGGHPGRSR
ncbi:MAG TPA: cobalt-precorrin-5B (C(1))-methyltransferase [Symbiobacteriaceae bacterium]|jgi:cobalt-precorrin-5B (C1)-methyltransferase